VEQYGFRRIAFADVIKQVAEDIDPLIETGMYGTNFSYLLEWNGRDWDSAKANASVRRFLQNLGVAIRNVDPGFWVQNSGLYDVSSQENVVVSDVRFPNEVDAILALGGKVFRVVRGLENEDTHLTETALDHLKLPVINNSVTLKGLKHEVMKVVAYGMD
jgi:hypothetical protein